MKFSIKNFGCRTNVAEATEWIEVLSNWGFNFTSAFSEADILILNSCVPTKNAETEVGK